MSAWAEVVEPGAVSMRPAVNRQAALSNLAFISFCIVLLDRCCFRCGICAEIRDSFMVRRFNGEKGQFFQESEESLKEMIAEAV